MKSIEIERKFLVDEKKIIDLIDKKLYTKKIRIRQGYLCKNELGSVRVRVKEDYSLIGKAISAYIMSKTKINDMTNIETDDSISIENANLLLENFCKKPIIDKMRFVVEDSNGQWEIDVFKSHDLVLAEIELDDPNKVLVLPDWVDREVTGELQYYNANM